MADNTIQYNTLEANSIVFNDADGVSGSEFCSGR